MIVWFTGPPGAGKSTLARMLVSRLEALGYRAVLLDGDEVRRLVGNRSFNREGRRLNVRYVALAASAVEKAGGIAVVALVSPYREDREFARGLAREFVEVYVTASVAELMARRPELYGVVEGVSGYDAPYEAPEKPEVVVDTTVLSEGEAFERVWKEVEKRLRGQVVPSSP